LGTSPSLDWDWWERRWTAESWKAVLEEPDQEAAPIRMAAYSGRPYGSATFVRALEMQPGRQFGRCKGGRPSKQPEESNQMGLWDAGQ
jgi:hypothetical protein